MVNEDDKKLVANLPTPSENLFKLSRAHGHKLFVTVGHAFKSYPFVEVHLIPFTKGTNEYDNIEEPEEEDRTYIKGSLSAKFIKSQDDQQKTLDSFIEDCIDRAASKRN